MKIQEASIHGDSIFQGKGLDLLERNRLDQPAQPIHHAFLSFSFFKIGELFQFTGSLNRHDLHGR